DLDLVLRRELRLLDLLPVHVCPVQAPDVADEERAALSKELCVLAGNRDVVEEDVALGVSPGRRDVLLEEERRPGVWATLHQKQTLSGLELVVRERELVAGVILDLYRREAHGRVVLQWRTALRAEPRVVGIGMSTVGAEQPSVRLEPGLEATVEVPASPSTLDCEWTVPHEVSRVNRRSEPRQPMDGVARWWRVTCRCRRTRGRRPHPSGDRAGRRRRRRPRANRRRTAAR